MSIGQSPEHTAALIENMKELFGPGQIGRRVMSSYLQKHSNSGKAPDGIMVVCGESFGPPEPKFDWDITGDTLYVNIQSPGDDGYVSDGIEVGRRIVSGNVYTFEPGEGFTEVDVQLVGDMLDRVRLVAPTN